MRARLVTRTAQGDRVLNVAVPNPTTGFMYRYCLLPVCNPVNAAGVLQYARARTVTTEVSLPNHRGTSTIERARSRQGTLDPS